MGSSRAYHDPSPYATACVKPYANGEDTSGGSLGYGASGYASIVRDKVAAAASSASSAAASLTGHTRLHHSAGVSETFQQLADSAFWRNLSPTAAWDSFIGERASYLHELQSRLGWEHLTRLAERWEVEPRIVVLLMLLPVILLLLSSCVFMGAGHTTDDGPPPHQGGRRGKKGDSTQASHSNADSASSSSSKQGNSSSGASSSGSGKGSKSRHGSKKGGAQDRSADHFESSKAHASVPKGSVTDGGSKATMLGSVGFRGAELQHFQPIDIYAAMGMTQPGNWKLDRRNTASPNRGAGDGLSPKHSSPEAKKAQTTVRQGNSLHDDNLASSIMEDVVGPSDSQQEQVEIDLDNQDEYEDDVLDDGNVPVSKTGSSSAKEALIPKSKTMDVHERSSVPAKAGKNASALPTLNPGTDYKKQGHEESNQQQPTHAPEQDHRDKQGAGPAGPGSESSTKTPVPLARTRVPRAHSFKEADRHRHQPHIPSRANKKDLFGRHAVENQVDGRDYQVSPQQSLAFKIMDFAQRNSVMKNVDVISGGVLGTAMATLAAGTAIAESSKNPWKGGFTSALDDLTSNLKNSFDQAMVEGGLEGSGIDQDKNWDLRSIASRFRIGGERPVSTARRFSVEDISVGPRTKYAIYTDPPQRSRVQVPDDEAPVNHDPKESDENVKVLDYQPHRKSAGKAAQKATGKSSTPPRSKVQSSDHEAPVNHGAKKPDEDVKILDYQAYKNSSGATAQNKGSKKPSAKSATCVDWGNATVKATKTDAASRVDWGNAVPEVASHKCNEMAPSSGSSAKSGAQSSKGAPKHSSNEIAFKAGHATKAGTSAKQALDSTIEKFQDKLAAAANDLREKKDHADNQVHAAAQDSKMVVRSAQDSLKKLVGTAKHGTKATVQHIENNALETISDVKKAVDSARDTAAHIMEASVRAVEGSTKAVGSDIRTTIHDAKRNARSARKAARKAKNALIEDAMDSRKRMGQGAHHVAHEARDTLRADQETIRPATGIAQYAKDAVIGLAGNVVQSAANQAKFAMDSVVGTTKKTLWSSVVEPVKHVERMVESAVEIGLGTVDAAIQGAREAAEKLNQENITATRGAKVDTDISGVNTQRSKDTDRQNLDGKRWNQGASNYAPAIDSRPVHGDQAIQDDKATHTQKTPTSKKAKRKAAKRQDMASAAQVAASDTQVDSKNTKESSSKSSSKTDSSRDLLSSAKHYAGGLGDAASESVHAAQIAAQTFTVAKDNTSAFIGAASNDLQGILSGSGHGRHELHDELTDIKNDFKQKVHFHGISSSASSAAKKANLVAQDYYNSLPDPEAGPPSTHSLASADSAHRSQPAPGSASGYKNSTKKATLDHEEYVFRDKDGNNKPVADVDEDDMEGSDSDESDGSDDDREDKNGRLGALISHAPGILHSAKVAATAMAARVADVSYENFDLAKHSLSEMVDNLTENLAGHEERDTPSEDDSESDDQGQGGEAARVRGTVQQRGIQGPGAKLKAQLHPSTLPGGRLASSKDGVVSFFPNAAPTHIHFQDHAYKPNRKSRHVDKDGFTIVEDPQLEHKHGHASQTETLQAKCIHNAPRTRSSPQPQLQPRPHVDTPHVSNAPSSTDPRVTTPRTHRAKISAHPATGALSYSAALKMNVDEGDHGPLVGRTEVYKSSPQHDHIVPRSDADSLFQNQDIYEDHDRTHLLPREYTLDQQGQKAPLVREARRDSGFDLLL